MSNNTSQQHEAAMQALRRLLFEQETTRIDRLEELLNNQELHAQEIAKILAEAVQIRSHSDNKLGQALTPAVEEALKNSIARNPQPLSDALFPVMGPAIRKAIQSSIASMLQSMNQTLEHSFSAQGLRWRWDAISTGKPFAEIVLLNTLNYRVEQIFLIHKETGLLLKHIALDPSHYEDADIVSSMLTAVQDFIHDSFSSSENQGIESLRMGDLQVLIEQGPDVVLALVCRGNPPLSLRETMQATIEDIQHEFHESLQNFDGDTQAFEVTELNLSPLLVADYQAKIKKSSPLKPLMLLGAMITAIIAWVVWDYKQQADIVAQWQSYVQQLSDEPGIVITQFQQHSGKYMITGLRDPLSHDPIRILEKTSLPQAQLKLDLQPYLSLEPPFILKRAAHILNPPQSILLSLQGEALLLSGNAPKDWVNKALEKAPLIAGISHVDTSNVSAEPSLLERILAVLKPDSSIQIKLDGDTLTLSGESSSAWEKQAQKNIHSIPQIKQYQNNITLIDSPDYVLKQAHKALRPPKSIRLRITSNMELIAQGIATETWIKQAKQKVKSITYISAYDDKSISLPDDIILQRAIEALQPAETVQLSLSNNTLLATGEAKQGWIDAANNQAIQLEGIDRFDNQVATWIDEAAILAAAIQRLQPPSSVRLSFSNGALFAAGFATGAWISQAQAQFGLVDGVHSFYTSKLKNTTEEWINIQKDINSISITFPNTIAKVSPSIQESIALLASLFEQAQTIESNSQLLTKVLYSNTASFITSLRLKAIQKELTTHGITKQKLKVISHKADTHDISQVIHFALEVGSNKP
ncbi:MAG: hypothetical protein Q9M20_00185 [Mariprofundaceae bacterium]|nr:hypothetical protein [Mariprofundaceae bacterium]